MHCLHNSDWQKCHIHFWRLLYKQTMYVELDVILLPAMQMTTAKVHIDAEICLDNTTKHMLLSTY